MVRTSTKSDALSRQANDTSDLAAKGLGVKRAVVLGQILPGVPVWELGPETHSPASRMSSFPATSAGPKRSMTPSKSSAPELKTSLMKTHIHIQSLVLVSLLSLFPGPLTAAESTAPIVAPNLVFDEVDGIVAVEAEHFYKQTLTDKRAWHITSSKSAPDLKPDADPAARRRRQRRSLSGDPAGHPRHR